MEESLNSKSNQATAERDVLAVPDTAFEQRWATGITLEESLQRMYKRIESWPWEKK